MRDYVFASINMFILRMIVGGCRGSRGLVKKLMQHIGLIGLSRLYKSVPLVMDFLDDICQSVDYVDSSEASWRISK